MTPTAQNAVVSSVDSVSAAPDRLPDFDWSAEAQAAADYVRAAGLEAPLREEELRRHASALAARRPELTPMPAVAALLLSNAVWLPHVRAVPPRRRLLLLPQCLRDPQSCAADHDAAGLLCAQCGRCPIGTLIAEAEALGYATLVMEGATLVRQMLARGRIDAVIGVGCLTSLEKLFPDMLTHAVPGLAVPLRRAGCTDTRVATDWVLALLRAECVECAECADAPPAVPGLAEVVRAWFAPDAIARILRWPPARHHVERLAMEALEAGGKRWRPWLCAAVYEALRPGAARDAPALRSLALSIECFHKASLVHDDIEDGGGERYGRPTLHVRHGLAAAINAGDCLVGEGYRLLAAAAREMEDDRGVAMLAVAAEGHRTLCMGQGDELHWTAQPRRLGVAETATMLANKAAPAFDVAVRTAALLAGGDAALDAALARFSRAFGLAFQIRDDIADFVSGEDLRRWRPNLVLAELCEASEGEARAAVDGALAAARAGREPDAAALQRAARETGALARAERRLEATRGAVDAALAAFPHTGVAECLRTVSAQALGGRLATPVF